jgi:hypothetical protein
MEYLSKRRTATPRRKRYFSVTRSNQKEVENSKS